MSSRRHTLQFPRSAILNLNGNASGQTESVADGYPNQEDEDSARISSRMKMDSLEASLRSEIFEKDRENDKLRDQIRGLKTQLDQRPPLEEVQRLREDKNAAELILLGSQRENKRMMQDLEHSRDREKALEAELRRLVGENWQTALNISSSDNTGNRVPAGLSTFDDTSIISNSREPLPDRDLPTQRVRGNTKSAFLSQSIVAGNQKGMIPGPRSSSSHLDSSFITAADQTRAAQYEEDEDEETDEESDEVEGVLSGSASRPSERERGLERANQVLRSQLEQVRLLVLGLDKRLVEREEHLSETMRRAEKETKGLESRLREFDLN